MKLAAFLFSGLMMASTGFGLDGFRSGDGDHRGGGVIRDHDDWGHHHDLYIDGDCDLYFDDDNRNGVGSIEGDCDIKVPRHYEGDRIRLTIRGDRGDRRSYSARINRRGRASFYFSNHNARDWRSRRVKVVAKLDGERETIFRGYLPYN